MSSMSAIFCNHGPTHWKLSYGGSLAGARLAVKDLFAVKGERNTAGNPDWFQTAPIALENSFAVERLMQQGCEFVGFTHTDELAYSLEGNNFHFGAAENPKLPGHACGGSSMGSAAAVAAGLADIGLGTDTGGSIRVPASYCGLYGIRPSHNAIDSSGLTPLAPAFDTTGWFSANAELLQKVGDVLLPKQPVQNVKELIVFDALFDLIEPALAKLLCAELERVKPHFARVTSFKISDSSLMHKLADSFRVLQGREIARTHADWIRKRKPRLAPAIQQRFDMALGLTAAEEAEAKEIQQSWINTLELNLSDESVMFLPTTPTTAPRLGADTSDLRMQILTLTAMAGLSGATQVHLPLIDVHREELAAPYGFSLLMKRGHDRTLLNTVSQLAKHLNTQDENK
jgi:amidase